MSYYYINFMYSDIKFGNM